MIVEYGLMCTNEDCKTELQARCTYDELQQLIKTDKCPECGADIRRHYGLGGIKFNGTGFTRRIG
jgi:predicted nucleic acid-binding Zn ribbon protein